MFASSVVIDLFSTQVLHIRVKCSIYKGSSKKILFARKMLHSCHLQYISEIEGIKNKSRQKGERKKYTSLIFVRLFYKIFKKTRLSFFPLTAHLISFQEMRNKTAAVVDVPFYFRYNTRTRMLNTTLNTHNETIISCFVYLWIKRLNGRELSQPREKHSELFRALLFSSLVIDRSSQRLSQARVTLSDSLLPCRAVPCRDVRTRSFSG